MFRRMMTPPPIPASCAERPTLGGVVIPFVNVRLADGGVDFRSPHQATYERCWKENLCQTCGTPTGNPAVLFGGPNQLAERHFDEPPLCVPCAVYASQACPMVAGRQTHYTDRERLSEGHRGATCTEPGCACGGWTAADPTQPDHGGDPAHNWYAVYVRPNRLQLTGNTVRIRCSDLGCEHDRLLINGANLTEEPTKVVLVSTQTDGRVWRKLADDEVAGLFRVPA